MNRKNIKRPESLALDQNTFDSLMLAEQNNSTVEDTIKEHDSSQSDNNHNVAFKNSFSLKKSSKTANGSNGVGNNSIAIEVSKKNLLSPTGTTSLANNTNLRLVNVSSNNNKPISPVSPNYLEKNNEKKFFEWTRIEVHNWIINLSDLNRVSKSQEIARIFLDNNITGDILLYLNLKHFSDMNIKDLKIKLILKKNIESLIHSFLEKYPNDVKFQEILLNSNFNSSQDNTNAINSLVYNSYTVALTEKILGNLSNQIIKTYSTKLQESTNLSIPNSNSKNSKSPINLEKLDHDVKKLLQNFHRLKEDVVPVVKHFKNTKATNSINGTNNPNQTPVESNYLFNNNTPMSLNGSPNVISPMRNIASPNNDPSINKGQHIRDSLEESLGNNHTITTSFNAFNINKSDNDIDNPVTNNFIQEEKLIRKKSSDNRMLINPFKDKKDYDNNRSPMEGNHDDSNTSSNSATSAGNQSPPHQRSFSSSSIKATSITINKNLLTGTPSPTMVTTSAYQTAQSALQTPTTTTSNSIPNSATSNHPSLNRQQSNSSLLYPINNGNSSSLSAPNSSTYSNFTSPTTNQSQPLSQQLTGSSLISNSAASTPSTSTITPASTVKSEPLKQLKAKYDDPCYKVLQKAMIKHKINNVDWRNYVLVICFGDKERILGPEEKPVKVFKELQDRGQHPSFMIRQLEGASPGLDDDY